ncbi:hypothetical protein Pmani_014570 [Petrolisthes manimaculis]|uniref:Uncharacterized protein n=1 Tax=Petrolisthes manimaculis TaxID=1843537 RepID=A0AAE1UAV7_9EUCA|nr:hypothetical protein Pmani_014570 [Petrolisthes manimaculis]
MSANESRCGWLSDDPEQSYAQQAALAAQAKLRAYHLSQLSHQQQQQQYLAQHLPVHPKALNVSYDSALFWLYGSTGS